MAGNAMIGDERLDEIKLLQLFIEKAGIFCATGKLIGQSRQLREQDSCLPGGEALICAEAIMLKPSASGHTPLVEDRTRSFNQLRVIADEYTAFSSREIFGLLKAERGDISQTACRMVIPGGAVSMSGVFY